MWLYAVAILLGALSVQALPTLPSVIWFLPFLAIVLVLLPRFPRLKPLLMLLLSIIWTIWRAQSGLDQQLPESLAGKDREVVGVIASLPAATGRGQKFRFRLDSDFAHAKGLPTEVQLSTYYPNFMVRAGERWRFTVRLKPPHGYQNPGGFDYEAYLFRQGVGARGYVREKPAPQRLAAAELSWLTFRASLKQQVLTTLKDHPAAPLVIGLLVGDRSGLSADHWRLLQDTGTAHLMAISGLHIGMVAGFIFLLIRYLWPLLYRAAEALPAQKAAAVGALLAAIFYAGLAGFSIPTQRALIMLALSVVALLVNRPLPFASLFSLTLVAVLLWDPLSVLDNGFWLSFAAVAIIAWSMVGRRSHGRIHQFLHVQMAVSIGLLPLIMTRFQMAPWLSPLANLLAIPVFTFIIVPAVLLGAVLLASGMTGVGEILLIKSADLLALLWRILEAMSQWPSAHWPVTPPPWWALVFAMAGMIWLLAPRPVPGRWLGLFWLLPLFFIVPVRPAEGEFQLTMLDVGQGLAVHVQTANHDLIFDTGPRFGPEFDTGKAVVLPYLQQKGVKQLDMLIISHGDNDHIGGAASVMAVMPVKRILTGTHKITTNNPEPCRAGMAWHWDGVEFEVLHPGHDEYRRENNAACVLKVSAAGGSALLPADIEKRAERQLLSRYGDKLDASILIAPHHGSRTSSTTPLLQRVKPRWILIPAGYRNRYHHPHPDIVKRYHQAGAVLLDSASQGAISLAVSRDGIEVDGYRGAYRRYWHHRQNKGR
ncbi:MAG: DNA internalization-related competence protein ComEC/Rec2 [Proteobacteria bacterium]|nr:DNA internalization-related competence protein ComEC/Rec2 [Pseudomonadota bacterium]